MVDAAPAPAPAPAAGRARLTYLPWLDGMRAVGVVAVLLFHEQLLQPTAGLRGDVAKDGLFGVDIFFVISGFLITTLLIREIDRRSRIDFRRFYERRARRLLPALGLLLLVLTAGALLLEVGAQRAATLRHVLLTLFYVANWAQAVGHTNMHELSHAWSLACEEQFYLLWPLVLTALAATRMSRRWLLALLAGVSALACAYPVWAERRGWSFPRVYYGLDTHSCGLLIGSTLAVAVSLEVRPARQWEWLRRLLAVVGAAGVLVLIEDEKVVTHLPVLAPGDWLAATYALVSLGTAAVIYELISSPPHVGHRLLGAAPMRAVGRISYALYLFGPPVIFGLTPNFTGLRPSLGLVALQLAVIFLLATASWWAVERWVTTYARARVPS